MGSDFGFTQFACFVRVEAHFIQVILPVEDWVVRLNTVNFVMGVHLHGIVFVFVQNVKALRADVIRARFCYVSPLLYALDRVDQLRVDFGADSSLLRVRFVCEEALRLERVFPLGEDIVLRFRLLVRNGKDHLLLLQQDRVLL